MLFIVALHLFFGFKMEVLEQEMVLQIAFIMYTVQEWIRSATATIV